MTRKAIFSLSNSCPLIPDLPYGFCLCAVSSYHPPFSPFLLPPSRPGDSSFPREAFPSSSRPLDSLSYDS